MLAIATSFGLGFNGGLFGPALFLGAMGASLVVSVFSFIGLETSAFSSLVLIGAGCVISAVFGAPIATTIVVLELANSYTVASAVLVGVVVTRLLVNGIFGSSYFDFLLKGKGVDVAFSREKSLLTEKKVADCMHNNKVVSAKQTDDMQSVKNALIKCRGKQELLVVDAKRRLVGIIRAIDFINRTSEEVTAKEIMRKPSITFINSSSILDAFNKLDKFNGLAVPVVNDDKIPVGVITESALIRVYRDVSAQIRSEQS